MKGPAARLRQITLPDGTVVERSLTVEDLGHLARWADGGTDLRQYSAAFTRLRDLGLVQHRFVADKSGLPAARIQLTELGQRALAQHGGAAVGYHYGR